MSSLGLRLSSPGENILCSRLRLLTGLGSSTLTSRHEDLTIFAVDATERLLRVGVGEA